MTLWEDIKDIETAKGCILSYYPMTNKFENDPALNSITLQDKYSILDFGCGIGRNLKFIIEHKRKREEIKREQDIDEQLKLSKDVKVYGYDFDNMIIMAKQYLGDVWNNADFIRPPVSNLLGYKFDLIIATLVFQHIPETELRNILMILNNSMEDNGVMLIDSRGYMDDGLKNIWNILDDHFIRTTELVQTSDYHENYNAIFKKKETR